MNSRNISERSTHTEPPAVSHIPMVYALCDAGQRALARGRYVAAKRLLEQSERMAWRRRDAAALARIYLPLLETCRQIRQLACEGFVFVGGQANPAAIWRASGEASTHTPGVVLLPAAMQKSAQKIYSAAQSQNRPLEILVLLQSGHQWWLASPYAPRLAVGLPVRWLGQAAPVTAPEADMPWTCPLAAPGFYAAGSPLAVMTGEAVLLAFEKLALQWQSRHAVPADPWAKMALLRTARRIDPACEPVLMRLLALAQSLAHQ